MTSKEEFAAREDVSRETFEDFLRWQAMLNDWSGRMNLVSAASLKDFWGRHALDSWQLSAYLPRRAVDVLDLGSGAGFPGLSVAIKLKHDGQMAGGQVTLVESTGKKAGFLRAVIRELDLPATVWAGRAEALTPTPYDIITARAFAPMDRLLNYAHPFWGAKTTGLFLKGQNLQGELTEAEKHWTYNYSTHPSISSPDGYVVVMKELDPKIPRDTKRVT